MIRRAPTIAALVLALLVVTAQPASAATTFVIVDSFEDGDVDEYQLTDAPNTTVQQTRTFAGKYALNFSDTGAAHSLPTASEPLPTYPDPGNRWTTFLGFDPGESAGEENLHELYFGTQNDTADPYGYVVRISETSSNDADTFLQIGIDKRNSTGLHDLTAPNGSTSPASDIIGYTKNSKLNVTTYWEKDGWINVSFTNRAGTTVWIRGKDTEFRDGGVGYEMGVVPSDSPATVDGPAPGDLLIRTESTPNDLITAKQVNATLYQGTTILDRETTTGVVSMAGLAAADPVVVQLSADGYVTRRTAFEDARGNKTAYLLNTSATTVQPSFRLRDFAGRHPPENTLLLVQRDINEQWTTVAGDYFGSVNRVSTPLLADERYRLVVVNTETGNRRPVGTFAATSNELLDVVIRQGAIEIEGLPPLVRYTPGTGSLPATDPAGFSLDLTPRSSTIYSWSVDIDLVQPDGTRSDLASTSRSTNGGTYDPSLNLTDENGSTVVVETSWTTADGTSGSTVRNYSVRRPVTNPHALLPALASINGRLPSQHVEPFQAFVSIALAILGTAAVATRVPLSTEALGGVTVAILAVFGILAWLQYAVVFVAIVTWLAFAGVRRGI